MGVSILPFHPRVFDYYLAGPFIQNTTGLNNFSAALAEFLTPGYSPPAFNSSLPRQVWTFGQGGTGVSASRLVHRGVIALRKSTTNVATIDGAGGIQIIPRTDRTGLVPGFVNPSFMRVNWFSVNMAMEVGTLDRNSGLIMVQNGTNQAVPFWPVAPAIVASGGIGIVGDGAGNWNWESYAVSAVPWTVLESVSLAPAIADPEDFHTFDFVFISATGTRPAAFQLWIDGALFLERNWETGTVLAQLGATLYRWSPIWQVGTTSDDALFMADWVYRMGRYLPDGRELLS